MPGSVYKTGQSVSRIKNHSSLLDCNDCTGSHNDYYIKNKINKDSMRQYADVPIKKSQWNNEA